MIDREFLRESALAQGVALDNQAIEKFSTYAEMLVEWNRRINLTAITDPEDIVCKHFVDSLTLLPLLPAGKIKLIDVGTGAGFPGVPLALIRGGELRLTLLDSLNKRLVFLEELCTALGVRAELVHDRAEFVGHNLAYREKYDVATARAVAALPLLCEYCLPLVRKGGVLIAMKGPDVDAEVSTAGEITNQLGGAVREVRSLTITEHGGGYNERRLVVVDKLSPTPRNFPRRGMKKGGK